MQLGVLSCRAGFAAACILTVNLSAIAGTPADLRKPFTQQYSAGIERLPVPFIENRGDIDERVALVARTATGGVYVTRDGELTYALTGAAIRVSKDIPPSRHRWVIKERLVDSQVTDVRGAKPTDTLIRRFVAGDKPSAQASAAFAEADLGEAWPGVRVAVHATSEYAEKFFYVAPGTDVSRVRIDVDGISALKANARRELVASTGIGEVILSAPVAWQEIDGKRHHVAVHYALLGARRYGFKLGPHDAKHTVVVDPIVQSTYIGGDKSDQIFAMTVHPVTGDIYVTGQVESTSLFPVSAGAIDSTRAGLTDAFIARLPADLKSFTAVTYFGGAGTDSGSDIKIHPINGDVYVLGSSHSATLPGTAGAAQPAGSTAGTPFIARLSADLQTNVRTTFYGSGSLTDSQLLTPALTLVISPVSGTLYIAGSGHSATIPNAAGGAITAPSQEFGYITAIAEDLASFGQGTYLCGSDLGSNTFAQNMTMDPANGDLVVLGQTNSGAMPTTPGAAQPVNPSANDQQQAAVIARLSQQLTSIKALSYYIDAFNHLTPISVMVAGGDTAIGGSVNSSTTPLQGMTGGAIATPYVDVADSDTSNGFVVKFTNDLTTIIEGTYVRGDGSSNVTQVVYDPASDSFFATGFGNGPLGLGGFPSLDPGTDTSKARSFVAQIAPDLKSFIHSNVLGTTNGPVSIARHPINGDLYIAGFGTGAPNAAGGAQPTDQASGGAINGVITRLTVAGGAPSAGEIAFGSGTYQTTAGTPGVLVVTRSTGSAGAVSVTVTTSDGTASAPADYGSVTTSVSFADGDTGSKAVSIPTTVRSSAQGNKTVNVTLSAVTGGATLGGQSTTVLTIGDAGAPPPPPPPATGSLQFSAAAYSVADDAGTVSIGVTRTGGTAGAVTVAFATSDGTGLAGTNYVTTTQTVSFADGDAAAKTVNVPVNLHGNVGSSFTVNLKLTGPTGGASLGSPATAVLTINATTPIPPPVLTTVAVNGKGGGGAIGMNEILLLGVLVLLRLRFLMRMDGRAARGRFAICGIALMNALGCTMPAVADSPAYYAGFGLGQARSDVSGADLARKLDAAGFPGSSVSLDDHRLGGKIYAGMSFTRYFALEVAYVDLGTVRTRSTGATTDSAGFVAAVIANHPYSPQGGAFSAMAPLPLTRGLSLFAKGGGFVWHGKIDADLPGLDAGSSKKTSLSGVLGGGIDFAFSKRLAVRAEWERYFITRDAMDLATLGLRVNF
jgi:OmpA-like transmembrane domain/Calx-beta domain